MHFVESCRKAISSWDSSLQFALAQTRELRCPVQSRRATVAISIRRENRIVEGVVPSLTDLVVESYLADGE